MSSALYFYFLILPFLGAAIPLLWLWKGYKEATSDLALKVKLEEVLTIFGKPTGKTVGDYWRSKLYILGALSISVATYGIGSFGLAKGRLDIFTGPPEVANAVVSSAGLALGLACLGGGIGMGLVIRGTVRDLIVRRETADLYLIQAALAQVAASYGFVYMYLILGKLWEATETTVASLYPSALISGSLMLLSGLLVGYLPARIDVTSDVEGWGKKLLAALACGSIALIGFVYGFLELGRI